MGIGVVRKDLGDGYYEVITEGGHIRKAWCVDLTPCPVDAVVAMADIDNWHRDQNVLPPVNQEHPYGRKPSTIWKGAEQLPPATCVMSYLKFDLWQRICPTFRVGAARFINYKNDRMDVELRDRTLCNVPVEYMTCNAAPFGENDRVMVEFPFGTWDQAKVVGFESNPRPCDYLIIRDCTARYSPWVEMEHPGIFYANKWTFGDLFKLSIKGKVERITEGKFTQNHHISPKGDWICFNQYNLETSEWEIWKCRIDGSDYQQVPITLFPGYEESYGGSLMWPRWSANGNYIVFVAGNHDIWYVHPDGSDYSLGIAYGPLVGLWHCAPTGDPWGKITYCVQVNSGEGWSRKMIYQEDERVTPWNSGRDDLHVDMYPEDTDRIVWARFAVGFSPPWFDGAIMEYAPGMDGADPATGIRVLLSKDPSEWYIPDDMDWASGHWGWPSYNTRLTLVACDDRTAGGNGGIEIINLQTRENQELLSWGLQPCFKRKIYEV